MASRAVMNESWKWRSGRERERVGLRSPSGRGGKAPHSFGNDERVAAECDGDVVVPAREAAPLEVIEAQLALEILVQSLGAVPGFDDAHEPLARDAARQRREEILRRLRL